jgi:hypothetical protein
METLNKKIASIEIPHRLRGFPLSREGYPIPWFVPFVDGQPEFRAMDGEKFASAIKNRRCWLCGAPLGKFLTFPIGPMCAITRTTAEPPSHLDCAEYAARACPFLTQPRMRRNEVDLPADASVAGIGIRRNPGVVVLWTCTDYSLFSDGRGGVLFKIGEPKHVERWAEGRAATSEELLESIESGYPLLLAEAIKDDGVSELERYRAIAYGVLGLT